MSSVRYSVRSPGRTSPPVFSSGIAPSAMDRLEARVLRREGLLHRAEQPFRLGGVVGRVVAHVDVDRHETVFGPGMDREMRLRQQNRAGHTLGLELEEP